MIMICATGNKNLFLNLKRYDMFLLTLTQSINITPFNKNIKFHIPLD